MHGAISIWVDEWSDVPMRVDVRHVASLLVYDSFNLRRNLFLYINWIHMNSMMHSMEWSVKLVAVFSPRFTIFTGSIKSMEPTTRSTQIYWHFNVISILISSSPRTERTFDAEWVHLIHLRNANASNGTNVMVSLRCSSLMRCTHTQCTCTRCSNQRYRKQKTHSYIRCVYPTINEMNG